jgi:hypothetical protein
VLVVFAGVYVGWIYLRPMGLQSARHLKKFGFQRESDVQKEKSKAEALLF